MRQKWLLLTLAVMAGLSLALVACGGGEGSSSSSSSGNSSSSGSTSSTYGCSSATTTSYSDAVSAATAFIGTLSTSQTSAAVLSWDLATARHWSNLPASMVTRNGVKLGSLSTAQRNAACSLMAVALSSAGYSLESGMQMADEALVNIYGASSSTYGSGNYYVAMFGTPTSTGFWMLQLTGHHLTYNIAFNGSNGISTNNVSTTPMFLGIEPKGSFTLNGTTYDPMQAQRVAAYNLGSALAASYSGSAKLSGTYSDILFGANSSSIDGTCPRSYSSVTSHGIAYSSLDSTTQGYVKALIEAYVNTQSSSNANDILADYESSTALASTYVAYAGAGDVSTKNSYIRVEGPRVWIEFSVQQGVIISSDIHYHTIWRDKSTDYDNCRTSA